MSTATAPLPGTEAALGGTSSSLRPAPRFFPEELRTSHEAFQPRRSPLRFRRRKLFRNLASDFL